MKFFRFPRTRMLTPTPGERLTDRPVVVLLSFLAVMIVSEAAKSILQIGGLWIIPHSTSTTVQVLIQLFSTAATLAVVMLWCRFGERRSLVTLGFSHRHAPFEYLIGLAGGFGLFGAAVMICVLTGTATVSAADRMPSPGVLLLYFVGFLIQGMSEELLCRSYLMVSLSRGWSLPSCALTNALLFSLLHLGNAHVSVIALVNILLFGLLASFLTLRRGSIWMVGALHSMWNFVQGNLFGIPVSGITGTPAPLSTTLGTGTAAELINGGSFGLEGGLAVTAVLAVGIVVVLLCPSKKSELAPVPNEYGAA